MKHYFIHRKGNNSEKLTKSQREQRKIINHYRCHENCNEVTEIELADEGVTEEDIRQFYAGDEAQQVVEQKVENGYEPNPTDVNQNTPTIYYGGKAELGTLRRRNTQSQAESRSLLHSV